MSDHGSDAQRRIKVKLITKLLKVVMPLVFIVLMIFLTVVMNNISSTESTHKNQDTVQFIKFIFERKDYALNTVGS